MLFSIRLRTQAETSHSYDTSLPLEACEDASAAHWHDHLVDASTPHLMLQLLVFELVKKYTDFTTGHKITHHKILTTYQHVRFLLSFRHVGILNVKHVISHHLFPHSAGTLSHLQHPLVKMGANGRTPQTSLS